MVTIRLYTRLGMKPVAQANWASYLQRACKRVAAEEHWLCSLAGKIAAGDTSYWLCAVDCVIYKPAFTAYGFVYTTRIHGPCWRASYCTSHQRR